MIPKRQATRQRRPRSSLYVDPGVIVMLEFGRGDPESDEYNLAFSGSVRSHRIATRIPLFFNGKSFLLAIRRQSEGTLLWIEDQLPKMDSLEEGAVISAGLQTH